MNKPSKAAIRTARALQSENARRLMAKPREEFMTQEEIAALIDGEMRHEEMTDALREALYELRSDGRTARSSAGVEKAEAVFAKLDT